MTALLQLNVAGTTWTSRPEDALLIGQLSRNDQRGPWRHAGRSERECATWHTCNVCWAPFGCDCGTRFDIAGDRATAV